VGIALTLLLRDLYSDGMGRVEEVVETLTVRTDGAVTGRVCLDFTVITAGPLSNPKVRAGVLDFYTQARERFGAQWIWAEIETPETPRRVNAGILGWIPKWMAAEARSREQYVLLLRDGERNDSIGTTAFEIGGVGQGDFPGFLRLSLPVTFLQGGALPYAELCKELLRSLPFSSARAGYSLRWDEYSRRHPRAGLKNADLIAEWYHGIDIPDESLWILEPDAAQRMSTINWLTALGPQLLQSVGGIDNLRRRCSPLIVLHELPQGVLLQAGPSPETGNSPNPNDLDAYREMAFHLQPILATQHPPVVRDTQAWLRRFAITLVRG
jgi:hypothetical protein